ncbi:hypothetical protein AXE80_12915 [Wenyingzhuangia fucanilytica]|uniref:CBM6 domain-containing protein n=1 Tax=Wenyingzhuangia fucanilytica TaxID=1790137 RepID=A0A1B1Y8L6_9FLAO|nr:carbohydrate-binding protein [Wenyingzhuangia fucanilytica]ANW97130.1 hypothetical protein AXE80_12915 [Wenyingzhuangia fucanilytica]
MKTFKLPITFLLSFFLIGIFAQAQITVHSLESLSNYIDDDNVTVKLAPGTYTITASNASNYGGWETIGTGTVWTLFPVTASNSVFDFTDVFINVETGVFREFGNKDVYEIRISGNNTTLKNLTLTDVGDVHDNPRRGALSIAIDGKNNVVDGFYVTAKGSLPYGYGDIFGKGGGSLVPLDKHSGILIRGDYNTLKNTTMIHRAFGHCVFMQAANHPTIDGCYIEGEMRSTDDILAEEGTGTLGDQQGFITTWGYKLPPGFMIALCEAGIRSYNAGTTTIDGVSYERGTNDVTVLNTTVKNTRSGCTITQGSGYRHVENVTLIGNENGFAIGNGEVINCYADAAYGPAFNSEGGIEGSVTLMKPENGYYNGSKSVGSSSGGTFTVHAEDDVDIPSDMAIQLGSYRSFRHQLGSNLMYQLDTVFSGATIYNYSNAAIDFGPGASNSKATTCSVVTDSGTGNTVNSWDGCEYTYIKVDVDGCENTAADMNAECFDNMYGIVDEGANIGFIQDGDWVAYHNIDLTNINVVKANASSKTNGGTIEVRLGSTTGTLIGSLDVAGTGGWGNWEIAQTNITNVSGNQDVYFVFTGESGYLFNVDWFSFENTLSLNDDYELGKIQVSPNPATNQITILNAFETVLEVFNANGLLTSKASIIENEKVFSLEHLSAGIYFLKFKSSQGTAVKKIVIK